MASPSVQMTVSDTQITNPDMANNVAKVKLFKYNNEDILVQYKKWIVESYNLASQMELPGYKRHNELVKGSGVDVLSKKIGADIFYGQEAQDIIKACETPRIDKILKLTNNFQNIK